MSYLGHAVVENRHGFGGRSHGHHYGCDGGTRCFDSDTGVPCRLIVSDALEIS